MDNKEVTDFISPVYDLSVSRVWRGHGSVFFLELGQLSGEKNWGEYTLWVDTCFWKLVSDKKVVFDGNEEEYEAIDKEIQKLTYQKILKIDFADKAVNVIFTNSTILECKPNDEHLVSLVLNSSKRYLNFESTGTVSFENNKT